METKLIPLTFSKDNTQTTIQCQKIIFKKLQMIRGDIRFITLNLEYIISGVSYKKDFSPNGCKNLFMPVNNGIFFLTDHIENAIFDFSNNKDGVRISTRYKPVGIADENLDFEFTIYYENL